ncbi:MAG: pyridoxine 5'-phosphate synthase [Candidatus Dadabacteria bacterium]|nr:pyridoxine 5'-phosphate synthase [Candidatus Dadabacteria bacterium]
MTRLNVNVDHVATVRQARGGIEPDPVLAAYLAELAGAEGIVVHLREDRRHIQERDVWMLRETVKTKLNLEMAPTDAMGKIAADIRPDMATLVPEKRQELTTEGGLDTAGNLKEIKSVVKRLRKEGIFVSLFIDPEPAQIKAAAATGAEMVEIHTGAYADTPDEAAKEAELSRIRKAVKKAYDSGLRVSAGHGLNYFNVVQIAEIEGIEELNIGHSIISRAVTAGMDLAVRDMIDLIRVGSL